MERFSHDARTKRRKKEFAKHISTWLPKPGHHRQDGKHVQSNVLCKIARDGDDLLLHSLLQDGRVHGHQLNFLLCKTAEYGNMEVRVVFGGLEWPLQ